MARPPIKIAPLTEADTESMFELYAEAFSPSAARDFRARSTWMFRHNPVDARAPAWVAKSEDAVVGHLATVAQEYRVDGKPVRALYPCDFMVREGFGMQGIALMRECFRAAPNVISLDEVKATQTVLKLMKVTHVGATQKWIKPLDFRFARLRASRARHVPEPLLALARGPLAAYDAVRGLRSPHGPRVEPMAPSARGTFDARFDRFAARHAEVARAVLHRDAAYLSWRYGQWSPHASRFVGLATDSGGELRGYVIGCSLAGRENAGLVLELHTLEPADTELWRALLGFAVRQLRAEGSSYVRMHHLETPHTAPASLLHELGFLPRPLAQELTIRFADAEAMAGARELSGWSYAFGDSETSYSLTGTSEAAVLPA
ncbi:MAG: hypothetical protein JWM74_5747 [Myxococcaceae bacterium]|nr:hypothetical protein [Myxococcaceae bacterium]